MAVMLHSWTRAEEKWELKAIVSAVDLDGGGLMFYGGTGLL